MQHSTPALGTMVSKAGESSGSPFLYPRNFSVRFTSFSVTFSVTLSVTCGVIPLVGVTLLPSNLSEFLTNSIKRKSQLINSNNRMN